MGRNRKKKSRKKVHVNRKNSIKFSEPSGNKFNKELAGRERSIDYLGFMGYLPNPDPILKNTGQDMDVYRELLSESHVSGCVSSRKGGVMSQKWEISKEQAGDREFKTINSLFKEYLDVNKITSEILDAPLFGFQPLEITKWEKIGSFLLPTSVVGKPPEWFCFDEKNNLLFKSKDNWMGEELPDRKFLCPSYQSSYNNPYGVPALSHCFWPVTFKKGGFKFWVVFVEKYGTPFMLGKHPRGAGNDEINEMLDMLDNMVQDAVAVIPEGSTAEIISDNSKGTSADLFKGLIDTSNNEISKALLGQTLTTEVGSSGSYAAGKVHAGVRADIILSDKRMVEATFNQLIRWTAEINFAPGVSLPEFLLYQEDDIDKTQAERDEVLARTGVKFTKKYYVNTYGLEEDDFEIVEKEENPSGGFPFTAPPLKENKPEKEKEKEEDNPEFAENPDKENPTDELSGNLSFENISEELLRPVISLIEGSTSFSEVMGNLTKQFPKMGAEELEDKLERLIFVAETIGRLSNTEK